MSLPIPAFSTTLLDINMYEGRKMVFGCSFKEDDQELTKEQQLTLVTELARLNKDTVVQTDKKRIYLNKRKHPYLHVFGIGNYKKEATLGTFGIAWSCDERHVIEALYIAKIKYFFPYKINEVGRHYVEDGQVYYVPPKEKVNEN
jgi:hypothetical protein